MSISQKLSLSWFPSFPPHFLAQPCPRFCSIRKKKSMELIFQRWISWFPQRWRTPRNAIRNANCRIKWVIKSLNANCCSDYFSWSIPGSDSVNHHTQLHKLEGWGVWWFMRLQIEHSVSIHCATYSNRSRYCSAIRSVAPMRQQNKMFGAELR